MISEIDFIDIFDLDIWELKSQYNLYNTLGTNNVDSKLNLEENNIDSNKSIPLIRDLVYINNTDSNKIINIFIENNFNINFLKNIIKNLFFNSKVRIFKIQSNNFKIDMNEINIFENDLILDSTNILSTYNKKHILSKIYKYVDFK